MADVLVADVPPVPTSSSTATEGHQGRTRRPHWMTLTLKRDNEDSATTPQAMTTWLQQDDNATTPQDDKATMPKTTAGGQQLVRLLRVG